MPRRTGLRDDDIMARLHDAERRLDWLEALPEAVAAVETAKQARADARAEKQAEKDAEGVESDAKPDAPKPAEDAPAPPLFGTPRVSPKADKGK